jgi:hypothetical protein
MSIFGGGGRECLVVFFGIKTGPTCKLRPMYVLYKGFKDQKSSGQTEQLWLLDKILCIVERF